MYVFPSSQNENYREKQTMSEEIQIYLLSYRFNGKVIFQQFFFLLSILVNIFVYL